MTNTAEATASPVDVQLSGQTYQLSPLNDEAVGYFERYCGSVIIDQAREAYRNAPEDERREALSVAFESAARARINSPMARDIAATFEGFLRLVYSSLRVRHPRLTLDQTRTLLREGDNLTSVSNRMEEVLPAKKKPVATVTGESAAT